MRIGITALLVVLAGSAMAQQHQHGQAPYAGTQQRGIKALGEQQISDLRSGKGMGLALAAELNGYPGPLHVLDLADRLELTAEQRAQFKLLYKGMKAEAIAVGDRLIEHETALDRQFAERTVSPTALASLTADIGKTQGELRAVHLKYHLTTAELLTAEQRQRYAELRGYH